MSDLDQYLDQLGRAHGFTKDELEANRAGVVHSAQLARSQRGSLAGPVFWVVFVALVLGGGLGGAYAFVEGSSGTLSRVDRNALIAILVATAVATLGFSVLGLRSVRSAASRRAAFRAAPVTVLEGPVSKGHVSGSARLFWFDLGGKRFFLSNDTWELVTHGATYRCYLVAGQLMTFEPVR